MMSSEVSLEYRTPMRMAVSLMPKAQDVGPTWAWFCIAPDVPVQKLWWVAWCAGQLPDRKPNDVTQKPQTCDVKWLSMVVIRLWTGASCRYWNDGFWLWTHAIFLTYRRTRISPSDIHTPCVSTSVELLSSTLAKLRATSTCTHHKELLVCKKSNPHWDGTADIGSGYRSVFCGASNQETSVAVPWKMTDHVTPPSCLVVNKQRLVTKDRIKSNFWPKRWQKHPLPRPTNELCISHK